MMGEYNLSDIRAATEHDGDGFGAGNWIIWVIVLFLFMFGGWNNGGNGLTQAQMQQGFDTQEITRKLDGLANGLSDGFFAQNTTLLNGLAGVNSAVAESRFATQQGFCETARNIDGVRYDAQKNTCEIITAIHAEGEQTRSLLKEQEMQRLRDELTQAREIIANNSQNRYLMDQMGRWRMYPPCDTGCGGMC